MSDNFILDPRLEKEGPKVTDLKLCQVIFANNSLFPWLILVPKVASTREIIDLDTKNQTILMQEISLASKVLKEIFSPYKLNVAALGNKVEQLHIHIVGRFPTDSAWPDPVFGKGKTEYSNEELEKYLKLLRAKLIF